MLIFLGCIIFFILCVIITITARMHSDWDKIAIAGIMVDFIVISILLLGLLILPLAYRGDIAEIKSVQQTVDNARINGVLLENAAMQIKIIDTNREITSFQYWNGTVWDIWIPDEVMDLKFIK